jgi:hypothetical protein
MRRGLGDAAGAFLLLFEESNFAIGEINHRDAVNLQSLWI